MPAANRPGTMIDRSSLERRYRTAVVICVAISLVPALLAFVAWLLSSPPAPDGPGSGTADPVLLIVFGVIALEPLLAVPLFRWVLTRHAQVANTAVDTPDSQALPVPAEELAILLEGRIATFAIAEYALWTVPPLLGFVGFATGATWVYFIVTILFGLAGFAFSFPRWREWSRLADRYDGGGPTSIISG